MKTTIIFKRYIKGDPSQIKQIWFYDSGEKVWYLNGYSHREDGPAVIYHNGDEYWYLNGYLYPSEKDYWVALKKI